MAIAKLKEMNVSFLSSTGLIIPADDYIHSQPEVFRNKLKNFTEELSATGKISGPLAKFMGRGSWEVYVADASNRLCRFQIQIDSSSQSGAPSKFPDAKSLRNGHPVVLKEEDRVRPPAGYPETTDYFEVDEYLGTLNAQEQNAFKIALSQIQSGKLSTSYSALQPGIFLVQINQPGINLKCKIKFV